jgi:sugar/nucleoside kinase (ribokinase family)
MDSENAVDAVVAGHICLDIIPEFWTRGGDGSLFQPGSLLEVGPPTLSTGGAVSNAGLALNRLGIRVRLIGKVGDDHLGSVVLNLLRERNPELVSGMRVVPGEVTSYSVVLSPTDEDRMFLHHTGANDTFEAGDVKAEMLDGARLLHFGYPPIMKRMYSDGGRDLLSILEMARSSGLTTSLDMAQPDPSSESGHVDWVAYLKKVLPAVDLFIPSLDEIRFMLRELVPASGEVTGDLLTRISNQLIAWGAGVVALKLGDQGLYVRTSSAAERWVHMGRAAPKKVSPWIGREFLIPCFRVDVVGTTGSGDCTVAGFLAGFLRGASPESVATVAVGTGAFNVESADATSGIPPWETLMDRIHAGWSRRGVGIELKGWTHDRKAGVVRGPADSSARS